jgi:hypothetical protein
VLSVLCGECSAELPQPRLDRIFPLGGEAGATLTLTISGANLEEVKALQFDHAGLTATLVKDAEFRVTIAANTPPGAHEVYAVGKYGISGSRLFAACKGLTEVAKEGTNTSRDKAQSISLNSAINGSITANADDYYRFTAGKGRPVVIDCQALRLDSPLRPVLTLTDTRGRPLLHSKPYHDRTDPLVDFVPAADGEYLLALHDRTFNGDLPYRLIITTRPYLELVWPPVVQVGKSAALTLFGRNLPRGQATSGVLVQAPSLEQLPWAFTAPAREQMRYDYIAHVSGAALNARAMQLWPDKVADALNPVTLMTTDIPVTLEQEPNDTPEKAQPLTLPAVVCGRFDRPGDVDWYRFTANAEQVIAVDLLCERLGRPGDPVAVLRNDKGEDVATFDDFGNSSEAMTQLTRDATGTFTIPADGTYHLLVQDRFHRGGPRYTYAVRVGKPRPDFYPVVFHEQSGSPTCPTLRQGGCALYELCLNRRDGFAATATVEAEGLPRGVTCPPVHIGPNAEFGSIVFIAANDAPEWSGFIRLKAWTTVDGKRVEREVTAIQRRWEENFPLSTRANRRIGLAVRSKAPYRLNVAAAPLSVQAGGSVETKVVLSRLWPDFKDKVQVTAFKPPAGFEVAAVDIESDKKEATVKLTLAPEVPPATYSVVLRGDAQVSWKADAKDTEERRLRVADPAPPLTIVVTAPPK